nr:hypothetical protein [Kibdelosporangium sp. MJ126-NF4]CEL20829.1 hypothetical protein [Kibdelosporangium sp. MJ126-NF4]CTQ98366.1 hypothetical protein [Kibdelosporangium sp. MJ126-NF4]
MTRHGLPGRRPRHNRLVTVSTLILGIAVGAVVAMVRLQRTPRPQEPTVTWYDYEKL